MSLSTSTARVAADVVEGLILANVDLAAGLERVFRALTSPDEITVWWVRPGVFDTRKWSGDVSVGGTWQASGVGGGRPYALEGQFLEVDPPRKLVHTWRTAGSPGAATTVSYMLDPLETGTRMTLRHWGFTSPESCRNTAIGWETSFAKLEERLSDG
jgi:uncharacterized protein YndB with AHSA1/START domain